MSEIRAESSLEGSGLDPRWVWGCGWSWRARYIWLGGVRSALKEVPEAVPGLQVCPDPNLAAACGCGCGACASTGAAWMDRTPSGDNADVTAAGSTPGGKR